MDAAFPIAHSAEELSAEARERSGLDIVDEDASTPLAVLVHSYNTESRFHEDGAREMRRWIVRILVNRLRMKRDFAAHPEIADIALKAPTIISCIPRTGSTKLQKLLAATGDFNVTPFWLVLNPSSITGAPHESIAPRIADADRFVAWMNEASPAARRTHEVATHEIEEDAFIMGHSLCSPMMNAFANCPSYLAWYGKQDHARQYFYDRAVLKYLIWQGLADPSKPFVLKSAFNSGLESEILSAFADAHLVIPHRHPRESVPSSCRLLGAVYRGAFSNHRFDMSMIPAAQARMKKREMAYRKAHPERPFLDVGYRLLTQDAESVVRQIYEFAGMRFGRNAQRNIRQWEANNPQHRHGANHYSCEEFGFTEQQIEATFADYVKAYADYLN